MDSLDRALALHEQAILTRQAGDFSGSEAHSRRALTAMEAAYGPNHPEVAHLLEVLGGTLAEMERYSEAEQCGRRAVAILDGLADSLAGPDAEHVLLRSLQLLGNSLREQGEYREAEVVLQRALKRSYAFPGEPGLAAAAANDLGILYKQTGHFDQAAALYRRALTLCEAHAGEGHRSVAILCHNLGGVEAAAGRDEEAALWFERATALGRAVR